MIVWMSDTKCTAMRQSRSVRGGRVSSDGHFRTNFGHGMCFAE